MKTMTYTYPRSSFLSIEKDMDIISNYLLKNENLKRLLYYTTPDCLTQPALTTEESVGLFGKQIRLVPKITVDGSVLNYIIISFDNFMPNPSNQKFRNNFIEIDIICHFDQWNLGDFKLRPYKIAAELDSMLDGQHLSGIGKLQFASANSLLLGNEFGGLCLIYAAIHGEEDKTNAINPEDEELIAENFDAIFNDK